MTRKKIDKAKWVHLVTTILGVFVIILLMLSYHGIDLIVNQACDFTGWQDTNPFGNVNSGVQIYQNSAGGIAISTLLIFIIVTLNILFREAS